MEDQFDESQIQIRLQRLWKGTLFVGIGGVYVLIVALLLIYHGWRPALLSLFFIVVSQFFRYIANDLDRIGWGMDRASASIGENTRRYQTRMSHLLYGLAQLQSLALIIQAQMLAGIKWTSWTVVALVFIEILFARVRKVNREVEFEQASYGFRDRRSFIDGPETLNPAHEAMREKLDKKLAKLEEMAVNGEIAQETYEEIRDRYRAHLVMGDDRILSRH